MNENERRDNILECLLESYYLSKYESTLNAYLIMYYNKRETQTANIDDVESMINLIDKILASCESIDYELKQIKKGYETLKDELEIDKQLVDTEEL